MPNDQEFRAGLERRQVLVTASMMLASCVAGASRAAAGPDAERPKSGDRLIAADPSEHQGKVLSLDMLVVGGNLVPAWPVDPDGTVVRSGSRLNKVVVIRVDPAALDERTRASSAEGVLAFSAMCTHQGCAVTGWFPDAALLACACHGSTFDVGKGGSVAGGPAKRRLAILPLAVGDGGALLVTGGFTSKLGYM
jgi:rieske iron-sulfur protein